MEPFRLSKPGWLVGAAVVLWATAGAAGAAPCVGTSVGSASTDDVNLGGFEADRCVVSNVNAQEGPNGNTSGFDSIFGGGWSLLTKFWGDCSQNASTVDGLGFRICSMPSHSACATSAGGRPCGQARTRGRAKRCPCGSYPLQVVPMTLDDTA